LGENKVSKNQKREKGCKKDRIVFPQGAAPLLGGKRKEGGKGGKRKLHCLAGSIAIWSRREPEKKLPEHRRRIDGYSKKAADIQGSRRPRFMKVETQKGEADRGCVKSRRIFRGSAERENTKTKPSKQRRRGEKKSFKRDGGGIETPRFAGLDWWQESQGGNGGGIGRYSGTRVGTH